jgi:TonB family protein
MKRDILSITAICLCFLFWPVARVRAQEKPAVKPAAKESHARAISAAQADSDTPLWPWKTISRGLGGGQTHAYPVALDRGQCLKLVAEQRGIDVALALLDAGGLPLAEVDSPNGRQGEEQLWWMAREAGNYWVAVGALEKDAPPGAYELRVAELRAATPADDKRIEAQRLFAEAWRLRKHETTEARRQRVAKFQESRELWRMAGERFREGFALYYIGQLYRSLDEGQKSLDAHREALQIWRAVGYRQAEAATLVELGLTFSSLGDQQKALEHYHQALPIAHEAGPSSEALFIRIEIIATCSRLGKMREAVGCYQKDLELWRAAGDRGMQAEALDHLGDLYSALGEQKKAVDSHLKALELWRAIGDGNEAGTLERLSRLYLASGDQRKAREYYLQSLELEQESQETGVRTLAIKDDLGQELLKGIVIKRVMPSYPPEAKAALVSGDVGVRITISEKGKVIEAEAVSGPELLREAALKAARQWRFEPLLLRGTPVKVRGVLTFNFIVE